MGNNVDIIIFGDGNRSVDNSSFNEVNMVTPKRVRLLPPDTEFDRTLEKNLNVYTGSVSEELEKLQENIDEKVAKTGDTMSGQLLMETNIVMAKASGVGLKVDLTTPTYGFADLLGDQFAKNTGASKPTLATYNGAVKAWQFGAGDEGYLTYHIPHDYVAGTTIFLHIHWSHIGTLVTGGTVTFKATSIYAKGHNQAAFTSSPATGTFLGTASTTQYQHILTEETYSDSSPTGLEIDTDLLEPDGVIELTLEMDSNDITVSGGGVPDPFIHYVDVHYQTTSMIGTKAKAPDFYA